MFKTRLAQNKDAMIMLALFFGLVILLVINLWVLVPTIIDAYTQKNSVSTKQPIDIETVNQAIDFINQSQ